MAKRFLFIMFFLILASCFVVPSFSQIPTEIPYQHVRVAELNARLERMSKIGFVRKWRLSSDEKVLTIETTNDWHLVTKEQKEILTRRFLDIFAAFLHDTGWAVHCGVRIVQDGVLLAEDSGRYVFAEKKPQIYESPITVAQRAARDRSTSESNQVESYLSKDILMRDLFGKAIDELIEVFGEPFIFLESDGQKFGSAIWEFSDYFIETDFHPVTKPSIDFLWFTPRDPTATMETVLADLKLDEFNGAPNRMWNGTLRWQGYIAQETAFGRVTWYPEDRSLAVKK